MKNKILDEVKDFWEVADFVFDILSVEDLNTLESLLKKERMKREEESSD